MAAKAIGYARVSTRGQDTDRQEADLIAAGVRKDDLYVDRGQSGAKASRPALDAALAALEPGDTLAVTTLDRLGRSTAAMLDLAADLESRGIGLRVLNLGGEAIDTRTATGRLLFTILAGLAQMELEIKAERNRDRAAKARAAGGNVGGRPKVHDDDAVLGIQRDIRAGVSVRQACARRGMNHTTYYRRLAALGLSEDAVLAK